MAAAVKQKEPPAQEKAQGAVALFKPPRLPWHEAIGERFSDMGVSKTTWGVLVDAVWPAAKTVGSVVMALSYCQARRLDPFKKPVHIVPVWDSKSNGYIETVWVRAGQRTRGGYNYPPPLRVVVIVKINS